MKKRGAVDRGGESKGHLLSWDNNLKPGRFSSVHGGGSLQRQRGKKEKKEEGQTHFSRVEAERSYLKGYREEKKKVPPSHLFLLPFASDGTKKTQTAHFGGSAL